jgi:hypothetical protein
MVRKNYKVVNVEKHSVTLTDGTSWQGEPNTVRCTRYGIELAQSGDTVSADDVPTNPTIVCNPYLETGTKAAELKPGPFVAPQVVPFDPTSGLDDKPFRAPDGSSLSADDIDTMLRDQAKTIRDLTARVIKLECFAPKHCSRCLACLASEQSSFSR